MKNVKGFIGLFSALAALILICIALFVPFNPIEGTNVSLHGGPNIAMSWIAAGLGVIAIIFGILAVKDRDKTGPRKAGIIIGAIAVVIAMISAGICSLFAMIADYANGKPNTIISQMSESERKSIDDMIDQLKSQSK